MDDNNLIEIIFLSPKNYLGYYQYIINDGEPHVKKNEELINYMCEINPSLKKEIVNLISLRKFFFIFPKTNSIEELKFDLEKELESFKKKSRFVNFSIESVFKQQQLETKKNKFESQDAIIKSMSKKNV